MQHRILRTLPLLILVLTPLPSLAWRTTLQYLDQNGSQQIVSGFQAPASDEPDLATLALVRTPENLKEFCARALSEVDASNPKNFFGSTLSATEMTTVTALLKDVGEEIDMITWPMKNPKNGPGRTRPFLKYHDLIQPCAGLPAHYNPGTSFPSGHAAISYLQALILGEIYPERRQVFLDRAQQIGWDRQVLGVHYPSDVEAGQEMAQRTFNLLRENPKFQAQVKKTETELRMATQESLKSR